MDEIAKLFLAQTESRNPCNIILSINRLSPQFFCNRQPHSQCVMCLPSAVIIMSPNCELTNNDLYLIRVVMIKQWKINWWQLYSLKEILNLRMMEIKVFIFYFLYKYLWIERLHGKGYNIFFCKIFKYRMHCKMVFNFTVRLDRAFKSCQIRWLV